MLASLVNCSTTWIALTVPPAHFTNEDNACEASILKASACLVRRLSILATPVDVHWAQSQAANHFRECIGREGRGGCICVGPWDLFLLFFSLSRFFHRLGDVVGKV